MTRKEEGAAKVHRHREGQTTPSNQRRMSAKSRGQTTRRGRKRDLVDQQLVKALVHPLRQRILHELGDDPASPSQLAERLAEPLGNVSYHVKILRECKAIELVRTTPVRGALEHFYRAAAVPRLYEDEWKRLPRSIQQTLFKESLAQIWADVVAAGKSGGFEDSKAHVSWTTLELDEQAHGEFLLEIEALIDRSLALQAEAKGRLAKYAADERQTHSTELALMYFHRGDDSGRRKGGRKRVKKRK
jgi:DNA-binding transcriptional ArsR family regulator